MRLHYSLGALDGMGLKAISYRGYGWQRLLEHSKFVRNCAEITTCQEGLPGHQAE